MRTTIPQHPSVNASELSPVTVSKARKGLYSRWETVNGKLTCKWFSNPD